MIEGSGTNCMIINEYNEVKNVLIKHNIVAMGINRKSTSTKWFGGTLTGITMDRNLYYDYKKSVTTKYSGDTAGIYGDPLFTTPGSDFTIGSASPAVNAANASIPFIVARDIFAAPRPGGTANDIGPVEKS